MPAISPLGMVTLWILLSSLMLSRASWILYSLLCYLRLALGCPLLTYEAFQRPVDSLPPARLWYGSASPTSLPTSSLLQATTRGGYVFQGGRTCPSAFGIEYSDRIQYVLTSVYMFRGEPINRGVRTSFPGRD